MSDTNSTLCPSDNVSVVDQSSFWDSNGVNWDAHRIGWLIAGCCALVTLILTAINVSFHCRNYTNRGEQRQILRILYMPAVYAIISFFSYRFFRSYTYYDLIETAYESVTLSAFLLLLIEFVAATATGHDVDNAILRKEKSSLPLPFCCWRYRPTKAYFMYTVKWSVLQYVILRPALSIAGIVCEYYGVLCESGPWSFKTAHAYITVIDGVSITVALYGLLIFYGLTKDELQGRKPLAKFLSIKLIVMFTFYQGLVFDALEGRVIKATEYWTETNIADGLNALAICIEMVIFSAFMMHAYSWKEYVVKGAPRGTAGRALLDSINYSDFAHEIAGSLKFFIDYARKKPGTHGPRIPVTDDTGKQTKMDFGQAFGLSPRPAARASGYSSGYASSAVQMQTQRVDSSSSVSVSRHGGSPLHPQLQSQPQSQSQSASAYAHAHAAYPPRRPSRAGESLSMSAVRAPRASYDENVRLAPYSYEGGAGSTTNVTMTSSSGGHGAYEPGPAGMAGVGTRGAGAGGYGYGMGYGPQAHTSARPSGESEYGVAR